MVNGSKLKPPIYFQRQVFISIHSMQLKSGRRSIQFTTSATEMQLATNGKHSMVLLNSFMVMVL